MARVISNSILDCRLTGSIGDKVFYIVNGKQYMKAKPIKGDRVARPQTSIQLDRQARFALMIKFMNPLRGFLKEGFKSKPGTKTPYSAAFAYNYHHALTGTFPDIGIDYSKVMVSRGPASMAMNPAVSSLPEGKLEFSWKDNSHDYEEGGDKVMILVYNPSKQQAVSVIKGNYRISQSQMMALPSAFIGDEVHCWMAFHQSRQSRMSDSVYVGSVVVG